MKLLLKVSLSFVFFAPGCMLASCYFCYSHMTIAWDFMALGDQFFIRSSPLSCHITRLLCAIKILCYGFWGRAVVAGSVE